MPLNFAKLANQSESLVFDLPDPLGSKAEFFADFLQRVPISIPHSGTHPQDVSCSVVEIAKLAFSKGVEGGGR